MGTADLITNISKQMYGSGDPERAADRIQGLQQPMRLPMAIIMGQLCREDALIVWPN